MTQHIPQHTLYRFSSFTRARKMRWVFTGNTTFRNYTAAATIKTCVPRPLVWVYVRTPQSHALHVARYASHATQAVGTRRVALDSGTDGHSGGRCMRTARSKLRLSVASSARTSAALRAP